MVRFPEQKLKLKVNRQKSGVRHRTEVTFLGYTLLEEGNIRVSDKSIKRLKDKVREITRRSRGVRFDQLIKKLNAVIIGWANYFHLANRVFLVGVIMLIASNFRDRHKGYEVNISREAPGLVTVHAGFATTPITPRVLDTWTDQQGNHQFRPC